MDCKDMISYLCLLDVGSYSYKTCFSVENPHTVSSFSPELESIITENTGNWPYITIVGSSTRSIKHSATNQNA